MRRAAAILALCTSCTSWTSTITVREARHVQIDPVRGAACASACAANDGQCLAACPGSRTERGECPDDREPGTCIAFGETSTIERDGRCTDLVAQLEAAGVTTTQCNDAKHTTAIGTIGAVLGVGLLLFVYLIAYSVKA